MQEARKYVGIIKQHSEMSWDVEEWIDDVSYQGYWKLKLIGA